MEVLSAALQDGSYLKGLLGYEDGKKVPYRLGHFFLAINIEHFIPLPVFKSVAGNIMRGLRNSAKAPGQERIWTAGEKEHDAWLERKDKGFRWVLPCKRLQRHACGDGAKPPYFPMG